MCGGGGNNQVPETEAEKQLAKISTEQWNHYVTTFKPVEDQYRANMQATPERVARAEGNASVANEGAFSRAQQRQQTGLARHGINPASGAAMQVNTDTATNQGSSGAANVTNADVGMQERQNQGDLNYIQMGRGQATQATTGMGDIAAQSAQNAATNAELNTQEHNATMDTVGTIAGAGLAAYENRKPPSTTQYKPAPNTIITNRPRNQIGLSPSQYSGIWSS